MCVMFLHTVAFQVVLITNTHEKVLPPCINEEIKDQRVRLYRWCHGQGGRLDRHPQFEKYFWMSYFGTI